jgi:hypothetical protein
MKRFIAVVVCIAFIVTSIPQNAYAARDMSDDQYQSRISEYFYSPTGKEVLIPVQILGSITRPGLYHIPPETNLATLIAISGGTTENANVSKVRLFREGATQKIDLDDILEDQPNFGVKQRDTIYIPDKPKLVSDSTLAALIAISTVASTVLTVYWIRNEQKRD